MPMSDRDDDTAVPAKSLRFENPLRGKLQY